MGKINDCPCGSGEIFENCCGPLLAGARNAVTAEQLMRSRFTANVKGDGAYLQVSYHASTRPRDATVHFNDWFSLQILDVVNGGAEDETGLVEFRALYRQGAMLGVLHEKSRFCREDGCWYYIDGEVLEGSATEPKKVGRNSPCPCGSGKKYKKCCLV